MPQAPLKKKQTAKPQRNRLAGITKSQGGGLKKGAKVIAPKNVARLKVHKFSKKITGGMTERTEKALAERAGHLELLAGGKKDKKEEGKAKGN